MDISTIPAPIEGQTLLQNTLTGHFMNVPSVDAHLYKQWLPVSYDDAVKAAKVKGNAVEVPPPPVAVGDEQENSAVLLLNNFVDGEKLNIGQLRQLATYLNADNTGVAKELKASISEHIDNLKYGKGNG